MITCGRCKKQHATVEEVKACYGVLPPPRAEDALSFDQVEAAGLDGTLRTNAFGQRLRSDAPELPGDRVTTLHFVEDGFYTIVFDEATDDRITLRVYPHWEKEKADRGEKVVAYLRGADNTKDYTQFAFLTPHGARGMWSIWSRFRNTAGHVRLEQALEVLHRDPDAAGLEYAIRSGNCYRCGRLLTVPASICRGLGPVCADKVGA